jgi:predicted nucleic acid-binding protein
MPIVVDASVLVDVFLRRPRAHVIVERLAHEALHAPVTIDAEVVHALRRHWLAEALDDDVATDALAALRITPIERHPVTALAGRMWSLRQNLTAYDAAYVALAEELRVPLLTRDLRLSRSSGHAAAIHYID